MNDSIETDYLVVGAGAAGMAFADALLTHTDGTVTIVDRRHAPGGHWIDAYPFVRLHQPSAFYGVDSVPLGSDTIDRVGINAGFYELANADELRAYYAGVMQQHFLPGGRVRYFPRSQWQGGSGGAGGMHRFSSLLTGEVSEVRVRRKLVDTTYVEGTIPATSAPPFEVGEGVRCVPAGELARLRVQAERFVIVGAGKTALDTIVWLLTQGVPPAAIGWIKPRESWWVNRRFHQPRTLLPDFHGGIALQMQVLAQAATMQEAVLRLEAEGLLMRVDPSVMPTMFAGAILGESELHLLRQVRDVVRLGRVRRIERERIVLEQGTVPTTPGTVHVHCAAQALPRRPLRPVFEADRVTLQPCFWGFACFQFAFLGVVEATIDGIEDKNRLCTPIPFWTEPVDYFSAFLALLNSQRARAAYPVLAEWAMRSRLSPMSGLEAHREHPQVIENTRRIKEFAAAAVANIPRLLAQPG